MRRTFPAAALLFLCTATALATTTDPPCATYHRTIRWIGGDELGGLNGGVFDLELRGSTLYAPNGSRGLQVLDVEDPERPRVIRTLRLQGFTYSSALGRSTLYVDEYRGNGTSNTMLVHALDLTDPEHPAFAGALEYPGAGSGTLGQVRGDRLDVLVRFPSNVNVWSVVDVSNPAGPLEVGRFQSDRRIHLPVFLGRGLAYLPVPGRGLVLMDVSDDDPVELDGGLPDWTAVTVAPDGERGWAARTDPSDGSAEIARLDLRNPASPIILGTFRPSCNTGICGSLSTSFWEPLIFLERDHILYVALGGGVDGVGADVAAIDVRDPEHPRPLGLFDTPGQANRLVRSGSLAFLADAYGGVAIYSMRYPATPPLIAHYQTEVRRSTKSVVTQRRWAYASMQPVVSGEPWVIRIFDLSDPAAPMEVATTDSPAWQLAADGGRLYGFDKRDLRVFSLENPREPTLLGRATVWESSVGRLRAAGDRVYLPSAPTLTTGKLTIVDVSDPTLPTPVGSVLLSGPGASVTVQGGFAYVAAGNAGVAVVDVSDPSDPRSGAEVDVNGSATSIEARGRFAYAGAGDAVAVLDLADPSRPELVGRVEMPLVVEDIALDGTVAYVAVGQVGVQVLDLSDPGRPRLRGGIDTWESAQEVSVGAGYVAVNHGKGFDVVPTDCDGSPHGPAAEAIAETEREPTSDSALRAEAEPVRVDADGPGVSIRYDLARSAEVRLSVHDVTGRRIATLASGRQNAGRHAAGWDASGVAEGVYFYRLALGPEIRTGKIVVRR